MVSFMVSHRANRWMHNSIVPHWESIIQEGQRGITAARQGCPSGSLVLQLFPTRLVGQCPALRRSSSLIIVTIRRQVFLVLATRDQKLTTEGIGQSIDGVPHDFF